MLNSLQSSCDREPIHILGKIQRHGFLIAIDKNTFTVKYASENIEHYTGTNATNVLGKNIDELCSQLGIFQENSLSAICKTGIAQGFDVLEPYFTTIGNYNFDVPINNAGDYLIIEFEQVDEKKKIDPHNIIVQSVSKILEGRTINNILENTAHQIKNVIGYDRVMIYKFWEDGHGEVIAESKNDELEGWLGLHYPASDIPQQARNLYTINHVRIISDVNSKTSAIITDNATGGSPLNLTHSILRAVSEVHIQYLKNMKVAASFSISILVNDELWGLIACHNYTPKHIDYRSRQAGKLLGQILASSISYKLSEENKGQAEYFRHNLESIIKDIQQHKDLKKTLSENIDTLLNMTTASGVAVLMDDNLFIKGDVPADENIRAIAKWLSENNTKSLYYTEALSEEYHAAKSFKDKASGLFACTISKPFNEYILLFKPAILQSITWAGVPDKSVTLDKDNQPVLNPRNSFAAWKEEVDNKSEPWRNTERAVLIRLRDNVLMAISEREHETRRINEQLKQAYQKLYVQNNMIADKLKNISSNITSNITDIKKEIADSIIDETQKLNSIIEQDLLRDSDTI